jgi:tetratricopeptide (TPR) repeat protein
VIFLWAARERLLYVNPYAINPPESEVEFEKLCLALLKRHWNRRGLERFAKKGEEQFGVDIFDTLGEDPFYAAQCKLKEQTKSLDPAEIRAEVAKAKTFPSKLDHYAILTTGKVSGAAQLAIQAINKENRAEGIFTVELFTWDKITELIRQYPEIEQQFYGGLYSEQVAVVNTKLDYITGLTESVASTVATTEIDGLIDEARSRINPNDAQIAVLLLNRIQRMKGGNLSDWHRFRIFTNLGAASLILGKGEEAARHFLDAAPLRPTDELAVANEVLAYHLLLMDQETRDKATAAVALFPNSTRIRSLWIQSAPLDAAYEDLLNATPVHMRKDAEIASALARRAVADCQIEVGIRHAEDAIEDKPKWSQAHLLLAQANFARVAMAERTIKPLDADDRTATLTKADAIADAAVTVAEAEGFPYVKSQALALKSDIALLQGRKEDSARYARESFGADPSELHGRMAMAQAAFAIGNPDEGIRILEEAYVQSKYAPNVSFMLGQALVNRGAVADLSRAFEVFGSANLTNLSQELVDPLTIGAIRALTLAQRYTEVETYASRSEVVNSPALASAIKAYPALRQGLNAEGNQFLDVAIASRKKSDTRSTTDLLARTLMEAGRWSDALPLLQELFDAPSLNFDAGLLLNCAGRLKRDDVILETCEALYVRGVRGWESLEFESQYLEEYDYQKAIGRLQEFITANPTHRIARLRLAIVAMRYGQNDLVQISEASLPSPEELPMRYAVATIHALQWSGQAILAVDYAYRMLRTNISELEAHIAYLASLAPGSRPDLQATMDTVEVGSAVEYSEGEKEVGWFVLENTEAPFHEFEELPATSDIAKELLGKRVGDSFILAKSPIRDRIGKITRILTKYTRRYQAIGYQMELKFGDQTVIRTMQMPSPEKLTAADMQPMLDSVKAHSEAVMKLRELYKSMPVTLHMFGDQFDNSAYGGLFDLAQTKDQFVRCAPSEINLLANAMSSLATKNNVVIDLVSLATLQLLGVTRQLLTNGAFRFVISSATYSTLQQLRAKARFSTAHGTMYYQDGQHYMTQTTEEDSEKHKAAFQEWMECVEANATVVSVPEVARLAPERREALEQIFGREGLEAAILALRPASILWTDDLVAAEVAKSELGVERVWTQSVAEHLANRGLIDRSLADEIHAKLVGFDFQSTQFTGAVILAALRVANGSVDVFPMRQMIAVFGPITTANRTGALRLLGEFILRLSVEPMLPETKCEVTKALLNTFPNDAATNAQLVSFANQGARLMVLNPLAASDFRRCFGQWQRQRRAINPFINQ